MPACAGQCHPAGRRLLALERPVPGNSACRKLPGPMRSVSYAARLLGCAQAACVNLKDVIPGEHLLSSGEPGILVGAARQTAYLTTPTTKP